MAKGHIVYVVRWTFSEYGGPSHSAQESIHLTPEDAEAFKKRREGAPSTRSERFFKEGSQYTGSAPTPKLIGASEYKRVKALDGSHPFLGPKS